MVFVVADAIEQHAIFLEAKAIKSIGRRPALLGVWNADNLGLGGHDSRAEAEQFGEVPAIQREIFHCFFRTKVGDRGRLALQQLSRRFHCYRLRSLANGHGRICSDALANFQPHVLFDRAESGSFERDGVIAGIYRRRDEESLRIRNCVIHDSGGNIFDLDLGRGDHRAGFVAHSYQGMIVPVSTI